MTEKTITEAIAEHTQAACDVIVNSQKAQNTSTKTLADLHQEMLEEVEGFEQCLYDLYKEAQAMFQKIKEIGADADEPHETYGNIHDQIEYIVSRALYDPGCWATNAIETYISKLLEEQDNV